MPRRLGSSCSRLAIAVLTAALSLLPRTVPARERGADSKATPAAGWPAIVEPITGPGPSSHEAGGLSSLYAQDPPPHPYDALWTPMTIPACSPQSQVFGMTEHAGDLVIVGRFGSIGAQRLEHGASWDGSQLTDLGLTDVSLLWAAVDWNGDLVVGGGGYGAGAIRRTIFRRTGAAWESLATTNGEVKTLAVFNGDLVAAGAFTVIGGVAAKHVARFDGVSWHAMGTGFNSSVMNQLLPLGPYLYLAGGSQPPSDVGSVARWDGSSWSALGAGLNSQVTGLATDGVDLYASGQFSASGASPMFSVARWDGTSWHAVASNTGSTSTIAWWNGSLYANMAIGPDRVARLAGGTWVGAGDGIATSGPFAGGVSVLGAHGAQLVALGTFRPPSGSGELSSAKLFDGSNWTTLGASWSPAMTGLDGPSVSAAVVGDKLLVAGNYFVSANGTTALRSNGVALWDGSSWSGMGAGILGQAEYAGAFGSDALVAGNLGFAGGGQNLGRWNGSTWSSFGSGDGQLGWYVLATAEHNGELYASGDFSVGASNHVARWDGSAWQGLGTGFGAAGTQDFWYALTSWNGLLVAASDFSTAGGAPASNIAAWNGTSWSSLGAGVNAPCRALASLGPDLVVAGAFTQAGGAPATGVARWDGSQWHAMGTRAIDVFDLTTVDGVLYAVGTFSAPDASTRQTVARWSGTEWELMGSGVPPGSIIDWVEGYHGDLYIGGQFTWAMGQVTSQIMRLPAVSTLAVGGPGPHAGIALASAPNPGRGLTSFTFALPAAGRTRLAVYDAGGRLIATLLDGELLAGPHEVRWAAAAPPGVYFARLTTPGGAVRMTRVVRLE